MTPRAHGSVPPESRPGGRLRDEDLEAAVAGDADAREAIYKELAPAVFGYLRSRGASSPEDLTSEVFLTVFSKLATLTGGMAGLRTFTFSVAHARLVDDLRGAARRNSTDSIDDLFEPPTTQGPENAVVDRMTARTVLEVMKTLPADYSEVLSLRIVAELSVEQTAWAMGRTQGAVKQLQRRALLAVREELSARGVTQ